MARFTVVFPLHRVCCNGVFSSQLRELGLVERLSDCTVLEILQDRITAHVQETCRGSFDCSYLSSLEEWLDSVVVAWLAETCIGGITRKRLQVCRLRTMRRPASMAFIA